MIDTNSITQLAQAAPQVQNALNAWHVVALAAGAYLAHAYHSIKAAGGIKTILQCLWSGAPDTNAEGRMQNAETTATTHDSLSSDFGAMAANQKSKIENQKSSAPSPNTRHSSPL